MTPDDNITPGVDETLIGVLAQSDLTTKPCKLCNWRQGQRVSEPALRMHTIRKHSRKKWDTSGNFKRNPKKGHYPSDSKEYRRRKYLEKVKRYKAKGLTAQGLVAVNPPKGFLKGKALANIQKAQALRRMRERNERQQLLNGHLSTKETTTDNIGESARAVILAAQVLRSVSVGLKL